MKIITDKSTALELKEQLTEMKAAPVTGNHFLESALLNPKPYSACT
jgi:hypothetical protein